jgi:hypothetical protein
MNAYRAKYRADHIGPHYRGVLHFAMTAAGALLAIAFALSRVHDVTALELAAVPVTFVFANVVEYLAHRHLMHMPRGQFRFLFERHTLRRSPPIGAPRLLPKLAIDRFFEQVGNFAGVLGVVRA